MKVTTQRLLQMLTGVFIAGLLGIHMVVLHLDNIFRFFGAGPQDLLAWSSVLARAREVSWAGLYIGLLLVGLYHGIVGLRGIIVEVTPSPKVAKAVTWVLSVIGVIAFIGGSYVPIALLSR